MGLIAAICTQPALSETKDALLKRKKMDAVVMRLADILESRDGTHRALRRLAAEASVAIATDEKLAKWCVCVCIAYDEKVVKIVCV